jgi:hypothetical protein
MPGVRSITGSPPPRPPASADARAAAAPMSSVIGPYSTSRLHRPAGGRRRATPSPPCQRTGDPRAIGGGPATGSAGRSPGRDKGAPVAGAQLATASTGHLRGHDTGADEAAKAWPVGAQKDRHVAGEVDGADGIGVVMQVRRMQPRLAPIGARPFGRRADQAHAGAVRVEVHLVGAENSVSISLR